MNWGVICSVKLTQSCLTLCNPTDYTVHGIPQARILEWVASPGDLPNPGTKSRSPTLQADSSPAEPSGKHLEKRLVVSRERGSRGELDWEFGVGRFKLLIHNVD